MRLSESDFKKFCKAAGYQDPAITAAEQDRQKEIAFRILMDSWQSEDRVWLANHKEALRQEKQKQKQAAKIARVTQTRRSPARPMQPFSFGNGPAKPLKFNSLPALQVPEKLMQMSKSYMDRFRWIEYD